jgi:hypothetical protein
MPPLDLRGRNHSNSNKESRAGSSVKIFCPAGPGGVLIIGLLMLSKKTREVLEDYYFLYIIVPSGRGGKPAGFSPLRRWQ